MSSLLKRKHLLAASESISYASIILDSDPVAYWPLDDAVGSLTAKELVGSLVGTVVGGVTFGATGKSGKAADFNGTTGYITAGETPVINMNGSSYEAWIYLRAMPDFNYATIVGRENIINTSGLVYISLVRLGTPGGTPNISTGMANANSTTELLYNTWYHYVVTHNGGTQTLMYVNGVLNATLSVGINSEFVSQLPTVWIGATKGPIRFWDGILQDVAIYSRVLTLAEINSHYSFRVTAPVLTYQQQVLADGATGYWPMNDVSAPIMDLAGARNATVTGSPTFGVAGPRSLTAISFSRTASGLPGSAVPVGTAFTLEGWIRRTAVFVRAFIMGRAATAQNDWYLAFNTSSGDRLQFAYRNASATVTFFFPMTFPLNTWTHVALVVDGANIQLYVNGVATGASQALTVLGGAGSGAFQLASNSGAPSEAWGGQLADLAIYPLVLTPAQILSHSVAL